MKKGFTLIELMIVIVLITLVYSLMFSNFNIQSKSKSKVSLENLKEYILKNFEFKNNISFICIEDETISCFVISDGNLETLQSIASPFKETPQVFYYGKELKSFNFDIIKLNEMEYEPIFQLTINKDSKHENIVVDTMDENVYLFKAISLNPMQFSSTNELLDSFYEKQVEIQDAF